MADNVHGTLQVIAGCAAVVGSVAVIVWGATATGRAALAAGYEQQVIITPSRPWESQHTEVVWRKAPAPVMVTAPAEVETPK